MNPKNPISDGYLDWVLVVLGKAERLYGGGVDNLVYINVNFVGNYFELVCKPNVNGTDVFQDLGY